MGNIGIMGGTFDPIHNGHLMLGEQAYKEYQLDEVWFMPSGHPPHKKNQNITDPDIRLTMTQLAIEGKTGLVSSDFEVRRNGSTYTAQTLRLLRKVYPQHQYFFIIGADSLYEIENWYEPDQVLSQAVILAARREYEDARLSMEQQIAYLSTRYKADIRILHCKEMDISSAMLRERIAGGLSVSEYVPSKVLTYIKDQGLYQEKDKA
ncbi:nicotinate-nucleotide adenylyltransferase [Lacrimispora sp. AGF001]|jgi:nicotinate-nucleotide adenylyltransferase|uniref:nicotinate-nucleotide adenylyltransferase n=1 Tax=Lacrimispora sp. AGF001 TaxID=3401631 RepID=UPI003B438AA3